MKLTYSVHCSLDSVLRYNFRHLLWNWKITFLIWTVWLAQVHFCSVGWFNGARITGTSIIRQKSITLTFHIENKRAWLTSADSKEGKGVCYVSLLSNQLFEYGP